MKLSNWIRRIKPCAQEKRPKKESQFELTKCFGSSSSSVSSPDMSAMSEISTETQTSDRTDFPSTKPATSKPESNRSNQDSDMPIKLATPMPESSGSDRGFQGASPIAKK